MPSNGRPLEEEEQKRFLQNINTHLPKVHGVTPQKIMILTLATMRSLNLTF
jgi:hypothetical protein